MPFTETDIVDERTRFIEDAHRSLHSFTWLCQHYGISRKTGYEWLDRWRTHGPEGLRNRSSRPMHISRLSCKSHKLLSYNYLMSTYRIRFPLHFPFAYRNPFDPSGRSRTRGGAISTRDPDCHERHALPGDMLPNCL